MDILSRIKKRLRDKEWRDANKDKELERWKKWKLANPEKVAKQRKRYNDAHPEVRLAWNRNRRARIKGNGGRITKAEWQAVLDKYGHKCLHPGCERTDITMDHVKPLALGGTHTADNVQPLCEYHNKAKYNKTVDYRKGTNGIT